MRTALVTGGSGALGSAVVRALAAADVRVAFTYHRSRDAAAALASETGATAHGVDLADAPAARALVASLATDGVEPDVFVHCAGVSRPATLATATDDAWEAVHRVGPRAAWTLAQALAPAMARAKRGDIVIPGALDRTQSLPMDAHFAAANGALAALAMALAKELGSSGVRANFVAFGPLQGGISANLDAKLLADYRAFSALRRQGSPADAARFLAWLAVENTFITGKSIPLNGL